MSDKCIACQFVKNPVEVRFLGHNMWIMECGIEGKLVVKIVYNKFEFSKKMFYICTSIWYNEIRNIIPFFGANRRVEANGWHYLITSFGNC